MTKIQILYRTWHVGLPPKPIKMSIPGWAGEDRNHGNGAKPQPWHCQPFVEGSTYGLELIYPFASECRVRTQNGNVTFEGDFAMELGHDDPPFKTFAPGHYGYTSAIDMIVPEDHVIRLEPHPSYYTDASWTTPLVVPGHIQSEWWPKIFFVVFKSPPEGHVHIFKPNQPFAQILVVPQKVSYEVTCMSEQQAEQRQALNDRYNRLQNRISQRKWTDHVGQGFDDRYRVLSTTYAKGGMPAIEELLNKLEGEEEKTVNHKPFRFKRRLVVRSNETLQDHQEAGCQEADFSAWAADDNPSDHPSALPEDQAQNKPTPQLGTQHCLGQSF